jgi:hypothetical protein
MAIQLQGNGGAVADVDGTNYRALRTTLRPIDYGALGSYRLSLLSGTMAAGLAANAEVWQFRWSDASRLCAITKIVVDGISNTTTAFTAGVGSFQLYVARSWTADGAGGTAATLTGNNAKLRTDMGATLLGSCRISSTAALTAGTKTLDTNASGQMSLAFPAVASTQIENRISLFEPNPGMESPFVLAQNEGLVVRATVPATGTWSFGITVNWTEITAY